MSAKIQRAANILRNHYRKLAEEIAEDVLDHADDFHTSVFTETDSLLERHSRRLCDLSNVFAHLQRFVPRQKPEGKEPLGKNEFRCFGCGGVINQTDEICSSCGWNWNA